MNLDAYPKIIAMIGAGARAPALDKALWGAERGSGVRLSVAQEKAFVRATETGEPMARFCSDPGAALALLSDGLGWGAETSVSCRPGRSFAKIEVVLHDTRFSEGAVVEGEGALGKAILSAFCKVRPLILSYESEMAAYAGLSATVPPASEWPIELCADGLHRAINREHALVMTCMSGTREKVEEYARIFRWNDRLMKGCAERFVKLIDEGVITETPDDGPSP